MSDRPGRSLRWEVEGASSFRTYHLDATSEPFHCVSSRSSELTFVLEGECHLEFGPARQQLRVLPGEALLVCRGTPHTIYATSDTRVTVVDLPLAGPGGLGAAYLPSGLISLDLERALWRPGVSAPSLERVSLQLLLSLPERRFSGLESGHSTRGMLEVKRFLDESFAGPLRVGEVARRFGLDRFYLMRNFKNNFGFTLASYVHFLRMEQFVWTMLKEPARTHTEVALESGFGDYSTFCRDVRGRFGSPPSRLFSSERQGPR